MIERIHAVLRRRENDIGDIIRLGDEWALAEWYPNNPNLRKRVAEKPAKRKSKSKKKAPKKKSASTPGGEITRVGTLVDSRSVEPPQTLTLLDASEKILSEEGASLHAKVLAERVNEKYGKNTNAGSLAGSLVQDPKKRFKNLGQNTWDLVSRTKDEAA